MKLIIQIPCLNEAETLPETLAGLPRSLEGFDALEILIIDDASTDGTADVARGLGVDHIVRLGGHKGLARAMATGLVASAELGADVIVNTDADNQYRGDEVCALVKPILHGEADIVIGARPLRTIAHFSFTKRFLQVIGSRVVQAVSGTKVPDATSGFRAYTREAALRVNVFSSFTSSIEIILQAGLSHLRIAWVPIRVNSPTRPSRLFRSNLAYVFRSIRTMLAVYVIYRPTRLFSVLALAFLVPGVALGIRYLVFMALGEGSGHVQSVIACAVLILCAMFMGVLGTIAYLLGINRRLLEEVRFLLRSRTVSLSLPNETAAPRELAELLGR